ncbi:MAG TPA: hypothetical protein VGN90_14980 [Pyrinomonadaceae bacterium]|jgi:hypothetical protein|nr:hypothetical protein [Pyrinomonadaceae bacterium]
MKNMTMTQQNSCETGFLERPRYYARQLLTPAEMTLEQTYFRDKLRRHNRMMHGWGVVCGAIVCVVQKADGSGPEPWKVKITAGDILGPYGDEIVIDKGRIIDLRTPGATGTTGENPVEQIDPWCSQVWVEPKGGTVYVAVKYTETSCRPVRVQPNGCGCDDSRCEYSRIRDGYEFGILDNCPAHDAIPPKLDNLTKGKNPECADCPESPWVVLAEVQVDADGSITAIDNCACRRIVISLAPFWRGCDIGRVVIDIPQAPIKEVTQGDKAVAFDIPSSNIDPQAEVNLGSGIEIKSRSPKASALSVTFDVAETAPLGLHTLTVVNPDNLVGIRREAVNVLPKVTAPSASAPALSTAPTETQAADPTKKRARKGGAKEAS